MSQGPARRMTSLHFKPITVHPWAHSQAQAGSREEVKGQLLGATTTISHAGVEWAGEYNWESVPRSRIIMLTWQKNSSGFFHKRLQKNSNKMFANPIFWRFILTLPNTSPLSPDWIWRLVADMPTGWELWLEGKADQEERRWCGTGKICELGGLESRSPVLQFLLLARLLSELSQPQQYYYSTFTHNKTESQWGLITSANHINRNHWPYGLNPCSLTLGSLYWYTVLTSEGYLSMQSGDALFTGALTMQIPGP